MPQQDPISPKIPASSTITPEEPRVPISAKTPPFLTIITPAEPRVITALTPNAHHIEPGDGTAPISPIKATRTAPVLPFCPHPMHVPNPNCTSAYATQQQTVVSWHNGAIPTIIPEDVNVSFPAPFTGQPGEGSILSKQQAPNKSQYNLHSHISCAAESIPQFPRT